MEREGDRERLTDRESNSDRDRDIERGWKKETNTHAESCTR